MSNRFNGLNIGGVENKIQGELSKLFNELNVQLKKLDASNYVDIPYNAKKVYLYQLRTYVRRLNKTVKREEELKQAAEFNREVREERGREVLAEIKANS